MGERRQESMKLGVTGSAKVGPSRVKLIEKARNIKPGERVFDSGSSFVVKEVCVSAEFIAFIDMDGVRHGVYHPDENLGIGEELSRKYAATYDWHTAVPSAMIH
jgi:hypothetical protein